MKRKFAGDLTELLVLVGGKPLPVAVITLLGCDRLLMMPRLR
jgi:hypothetical protein